MLVKLVLICLVLSVEVESANILAVYPTPSISHQVVFRKVTLELVKQGHEVIVITADPAFPNKDGPKNLIEINLHVISYNAIREVYHEVPKSEIKNKLSDLNFFLRFAYELCEIQLQVPEVQELLLKKKKQFDLIFIEDIARPYLAISHIFDAPVILFSSASALPQTFEFFALRSHPFLYQSLLYFRYYNLSLWEKVNNLHKHFTTLYDSYFIEEEGLQMLEKYFGPEIPKLSQLYNNVNMVFLNVHSIWIDNPPVPPSVVFIGGLHQLETKELPQDLKSYLDSSKHGIIYVSFGTNALSTMLPIDKIEIIAKVLGQLPYDVLWKWDQDELPGGTKNIRLLKWFPQADLLKQPLIAFPLIADQWYNSEKYVHLGIGKKILFEETTEDIVKNAVETVITEESYRNNIIKLRELMNDQPMQPLERAMFWINHVIRNKGGKHLLAAGTNLTWAQYYEVEILLLLLSTILVSLFLLSCVLYYVHKFVKNYMNDNKKRKKN